MSHFFSKTSTLRIYRRNMRLNLARVKAIMAIGMPPFFLQIAVCILTIVLNKSMEHYGGDTAVSGMGAVTTIQMLVILPIAGISMGAQPIIGFNYGARSFDRVREVLKMAIISGSTIAVLGWLMIQIFSHPPDGHVRQAGSRLRGLRLPGPPDLLGPDVPGGLPGGRLQLLPGHRQSPWLPCS